MPLLWAPGGFPAVPAAPELPSIFAEWSVPENGYASNGQLKEMNVILSRDGGVQGRDFSMEYDGLGRTISSSIDSDEWGLARGFTYAYDIPRRRYTRTGPDGVETLMEFDIANRVTLLRRGPEANPLIEVQYDYYANGLLYRVRRGLTFHTVYSYDAANQVTSIDHQSGAGNLPNLWYT